MMNRSHVEAALAAALATGGDFSELFFQDCVENNLSMSDGRIENAVQRTVFRYQRMSNAVGISSRNSSVENILQHFMFLKSHHLGIVIETLPHSAAMTFVVIFFFLCLCHNTHLS